MVGNRSLYVMVFTASLAGLAYEIALVRIFSISLWYHFAFMVVSIAMLGIGASGTALSLFPRGKEARLIPFYALALGLGIPLTYLIANNIPFDPGRLSWDRVQLLSIGLYCVVLSLPFFCFGLTVSTAYSNLSPRSRRIYAADLIGAGAGSLLTLCLLHIGGPEKAVFIVAGLPLLAVLLFPGRTIKLLSIAGIVAYCALLFVDPAFIHPRISAYKPLPVALQFPGAKHLRTYYGPYSRVDLFESPAARFAPGLSLRYPGDLPAQTGVAVDAGNISAITDERGKDVLVFLDYLPSSLPYALGPKKDVLVLEPGGGLPVLTAKRHGTPNVYSVQSDPLVLRAVREQARQSSSDLYKEHAWPGLGRAWLAARKDAFNVIDISMTGPLPFGFSEDYRFTVEAFQTYLKHLKPDGFLSINLFMLPPPRTELRLIASIALASERLGMAEFPGHVAAIRSWDSLTVVMKKSALTEDDINGIRRFSREKKFDLVYYPGITPEEKNVYVRMQGNEYDVAFQRLIGPDTRSQFIRDYLFDIRPVGDEDPFFHYYLNVKNLGTIYGLMGEKWQYLIEEGYLLPVLFLQIFIACAVLVLLPLLKLRGRTVDRKRANTLPTLLYFGSLGFGFMFVELAFIQKMILTLENPPFAMSTVILGVLFGSGAGSLLSERVGRLKKHRVVLLIAAAVLLYSLLLPFVIRAVLPYSLPAKAALVFLTVLPAGLLMGIPFPLGLSQLGARDPELVPWAWAVNGCCSVLAPVLAVMIALSAGYGTVLYAAAAMYVCAYGAAVRMGKS